METSIVKRSKILCWHILYIAMEENTTKTIIKNTVFAFFTKEVKTCFGNLAQLYTCERQMPAGMSGFREMHLLRGGETRPFQGN